MTPFSYNSFENSNYKTNSGVFMSLEKIEARVILLSLDRYLYTFLFFLLLAQIGLASASSNPKKITLATHDLPPYGSYQDDGSFKGVAVDRIYCALDEIDVELNLRVVPWKRAQHEVKKKQIDGFFAGSQNNERDRYAEKSIELADQKWQWYVLNSSNWVVNSDSFKKKAKVSSFLGANMQKWLTENAYNIVDTPKDTVDLAEMLVRGRVDAALANNYVMDAILEQRGLTDKVSSYLLKSKPLYVYFHKEFIENNPNFLRSFNVALFECKKKR